MSLIILEFDCPDHGRFEAMVERSEPNDTHPCPDCEVPAPWTISAPLVRIKLASAATQGGYVKPDHPLALDTRELGEGMSMQEWRAKRAKKWAEHDHNDPRKRELAAATDKVLNKADGVVRDRPDQKKKRFSRFLAKLGKQRGVS